MPIDTFSGVIPFVHVAEERNFRRAAARLGVTPAAVSKAVARLEAQLGVTLLRRSSRHVALTQQGALYLERCRAALDQLKAARELVAEHSALSSGPLKVTLSPVLASRVLANLGALAAQYPQLTFALSVTDRFANLAEEEVDLGIRIGQLEDSTLVSRVLARPRWVTVGSPAYLAQRGVPKTPTDLDGHDAVKFLRPSGLIREWAFRAKDPRQRRVRGMRERLVIDNGELLVDAAVAGVGIAQVFDFMVEEHLRHGRLQALLSDFAQDAPPIRAVWTGRRQPLPRARLFLEFIEALFRPRP